MFSSQTNQSTDFLRKLIGWFLYKGTLIVNGLVVKALNSRSRGPAFKTTAWLQGRLSLSSFRGR